MKKRGIYFIFSIIYTISLVFFSWILICGNYENYSLAEAAISTGLTAVNLEGGDFDSDTDGEKDCQSDEINTAENNKKGSHEAASKSAKSSKKTKTEATSKKTESIKSSKKSKAGKNKSLSSKPLVLIYHTHGTESYLPAKSGNYHTTKEENSVRDVGNILEESLAEEGIMSIHDKTIHDNPSYDGSYDRSFNQVKKILAEYPSIVCIIDLHRDAIAGDYAGDTAEVYGKTAATYSYVLSNTTDTYADNKAFLRKLNDIAGRDYDGYTGKVLQRPYWYNQEICGKAVLIEMGNNRNRIEDVRNTAWLFGKILAKALN